jgi:hypothetical protein
LPLQFRGRRFEFAAKHFKRSFRCMRPKPGRQRLHCQNVRPRLRHKLQNARGCKPVPRQVNVAAISNILSPLTITSGPRKIPAVDPNRMGMK